MDYYSFQASSGDLLCFEIDFLSSSAPMGLWTFRPTLSIYELKGSWFDPSRRARLTSNDPMLLRPTLDFRLPKDGEYFWKLERSQGNPGNRTTTLVTSCEFLREAIRIKLRAILNSSR
jgi:hypothetical protein